LRDKVSKEKHDQIKDNFANKAGNKVNVDANEAQAKLMADRIGLKFDKDE